MQEGRTVCWKVRATPALDTRIIEQRNQPFFGRRITPCIEAKGLQGHENGILLRLVRWYSELAIWSTHPMPARNDASNAKYYDCTHSGPTNCHQLPWTLGVGV